MLTMSIPSQQARTKMCILRFIVVYGACGHVHYRQPNLAHTHNLNTKPHSMRMAIPKDVNWIDKISFLQLCRLRLPSANDACNQRNRMRWVMSCAPRETKRTNTKFNENFQVYEVWSSSSFLHRIACPKFLTVTTTPPRRHSLLRWQMIDWQMWAHALTRLVIMIINDQKFPLRLQITHFE